MKVVKLDHPLDRKKKREICNLFSLMQKESGGYYPLLAATEHSGGLDAWLDLDSKRLRFGAFEKEELVGYVELDFLGKYIETEKESYWAERFPAYCLDDLAAIRRFGVHPGFRKRGLGSLLLARAREDAAGKICVLVVLARLQEAIDMYEKQGAYRVGQYIDLEETIYSYLFK